MLEPTGEYKADHKGKYTRLKDLGSKDNPLGDIKHCPIWGENYKVDGFIAWEYKDRVIRKSPRTDGGYVITMEADVNIHSPGHELNDSEKAYLTTWLVNERFRGNELPKITTDQTNDIKNWRPLSLEERIMRLLQYAVKKSPVEGTHLTLGLPLIEEVIDVSESWEAMALSESINYGGLKYLVDHLIDKNLLKKDPTAATAIGNPVCVTVEGYTLIEGNERRHEDKNAPVMSLTPALFEQLLNQEEGIALDFKREQYPFDGKPKDVQSELLKDILAFANTQRNSSAYILIGVEEVKGGRSKVVGVENHLDDAKLQQFVNSKTQPPVDFAYFPFRTEGVEVGIIEIPIQKRPIYPKRTFGKVKENIVYIRRGSATMTATPDESTQMSIESASLASGVTPQIVSESEDSNEPFWKQNFENFFSQLLDRHSEIVNSIVIRRGIDGEYFGRECFGYMLQHLRRIYMGAHEQFHAGMHSGDAREVMYEWVNEKYEKFFAEYQSHIDHYFRHLYNVVKFVDDQKDFPKEFQGKKRYTNLIRAQLSSDELGLLFYNCLSKRGAKFRDLVEKYALLQDMRFETLINQEHKNLYAPSAYGEFK